MFFSCAVSLILKSVGKGRIVVECEIESLRCSCMLVWKQALVLAREIGYGCSGVTEKHLMC